MTRQAFMGVCRLHDAGDDPPIRIEITGGLTERDMYVCMRYVAGGSSYPRTLYCPMPGRQWRIKDKRDALLTKALAKYQRWLTDFRGSLHQ